MNGGLSVRNIIDKVEKEDRFGQTFVQGMFGISLPEVFPFQRCKTRDVQYLDSPCRTPRLYLTGFSLGSRVLR